MKNEGGGKFDYLFKILVIGETAVGKTCLLLRYTDNTFNVGHLATIGIDFKIKEVDIEGKNVKLQIWDTAGQERFKNITASYYRGGNGILVVYDITDRESFNNLNSWLIEIEKSANKNVYKILIGNKCDLEEKRAVTYQEGKDLADSNGMKFIETSAKTCQQVNEAFETLTQEIIKLNASKDKVLQEPKKKEKVLLSNNATDISKKKNCC